MSQTTVPTASAPDLSPAVRTVTPPTDAAPLHNRLLARPARELARSGLEGTPGRMRIAAALAVLACLVFAGLGGYAFRGWGGALNEARGDAAQLVRVQTIQNDLVKADAAASNAYLAGGSEDPLVRADYDAAIEEAARLLAEPAATTQDSATLAEAVAGLAEYTGLVEQARANNRQGLQVGAAYLREAGTVLRDQIVPALEKVSQNDQRRVADAYQRMNLFTALLIVSAVVTLAMLVAVQVWLGRRTRRIINVPLAIATVVVLAGTVVGAVVITGAADRARQTAAGPYAATVALASARTAAFDAKAQESLGLIARGNSGPAEEIAQERITAASTDLVTARDNGAGGESNQTFGAWVERHKQVRAADLAGSWGAARELALGDSNEAFTTFDDASAVTLAEQAGQVDEALAAPRTSLVLLGWLVLTLGIGAAVTSMIGIGQRLGEYR